MKLSPALRTPYRARAVVSGGASGPLRDAQLGRAMAVTQLAVVLLCVARVEADRVRGPLGVEGRIALAVGVAVSASLVLALMRRAVEWLRVTASHTGAALRDGGRGGG